MGSEGLREQKKKRAHEALERAAMRLFAERGYESTTIRDIAEKAGMSPRTFFRYFGSKEDVVFTTAGENFAVLQGLLRQRRNSTSLFQILKETMFDFADHLQNQPPDDVALRARLISGSPELRRRLAEEVHGWEEELVRHLAALEGTAVQPRHRLLAGTVLQALIVAGTTWGANIELSFTGLLKEMFDELEAALNESRSSETAPPETAPSG